ncbi:MAG: protein-L-isoaspartate(D-aspartate) O-methyltransferase, partial [Acidimicrobiia bacterium]
ARLQMVDQQLAARDISDGRVLDAMRRVPRHEFVPEHEQGAAYTDHPLPIGHGVTISQPYIVAFMTQALRLRPGDRVLEVGTGSGYAAAVLAEIVDDVTTIECIEPLADLARERLARYGDRVHVVTGDGSLGYEPRAPYDGIVVTAAAPEIPQPLLDQLAPGGRLVIPVGRGDEQLVRVTRTAHGDEHEQLLPVRFVPLTGAHGRHG